MQKLLLVGTEEELGTWSDELAGEVKKNNVQVLVAKTSNEARGIIASRDPDFVAIGSVRHAPRLFTRVRRMREQGEFTGYLMEPNPGTYMLYTLLCLRGTLC